MKTLMNASGFGAGMILILIGCGGAEAPLGPPPPVPAEYQGKHMPEGWWTDPAIIEEGRKIFIGEHNIDVNCASCHGKDGKPVKKGARDFRQIARMELLTDSFRFWRISEGVKNTKMKAWKEKLTEEEIWKVIAYENTFAFAGTPTVPTFKEAPAPTGAAQ